MAGRLSLKNADMDLLIAHDWTAYFRFNKRNLMHFDYSLTGELTGEEKALITPSLQAFQLGEGSDGNHLRLAAERFAGKTGYYKYPEMIRFFIGEENRHSAALRKFMEVYGIPLIRSNWLDCVFRFLRRRMGIEGEITVLVTAEMIALAYYSALSNATGSSLLKTICAQMLRDEYMHVVFQSETLHRIYNYRNRCANRCMAVGRRGFMGATLTLVWMKYRKVFRRGGYSYLRLLRDCMGCLTDSIRIARYGSL